MADAMLRSDGTGARVRVRGELNMSKKTTKPETKGAKAKKSATTAKKPSDGTLDIEAQEKRWRALPFVRFNTLPEGTAIIIPLKNRS